EKLGASIGSQTTLRQDRLDAALKELRSVRNVHAKLGDQLSSLANVELARRETAQYRAALVELGTGGGAAEVIGRYLAQTRERIVAIETKIDEIRDMYSTLGERMRREFGINVPEVHPFATQRFHTELQKIHECADSEFPAATGGILARRKGALGEQFQELIGNRVVHIFEIAAREAAAWMRGLYTGVERPFEKFRDETLQRAANAEKLMGAGIDLAGQIAELQGHLDAIRRKHQALREARSAFARFSGQDDGDAGALSDVATESVRS
ncbi:MAG TPA: hypothetical protein VFV17_00675, partial [Usitatibacteraceae bacterium]|nr:hypothetical protein [Usitatibacteraceae bacterium]